MTLSVPAAILAERQRQIAEEGYVATHDDAHDSGELLAVAVMYYQRSIGIPIQMREIVVRGLRRSSFSREAVITKHVPVGFPWDSHWWKPKTPQRDLERAGALCLAEIDRLKRAGKPVAHVEEQLGAIVSAYNGLPSSWAAP